MLRQEDIDKIRSFITTNCFEQAKKYLHHFEELIHNDKNVYILLGEVYNKSDNLYEAERYYKKALQLDPINIHCYAVLESILRIQGRHKECEDILNKIKIIKPDMQGTVDTSLSMLYLDRGKIYKGFQMYENRYAFKHMGDSYSKEWFPRWDGKQPLQGKTILLRQEQGLGDGIQFLRYAESLVSLGAKAVDLFSKDTIHRIALSNTHINRCLCNKDDFQYNYDYEVMMMSMPALMKHSKLSDIPSKPYLSVKPEDSLVWKSKLNNTNKLKVGLVWSGELKKTLGFDGMRMNRLRSIPLEMWRPILDVGCDFYSLQFGDEQRQQLKDFHAAHKITDLIDGVIDFYDTACLIDNLDLVITVDTSTCHLSGALGKETWMLNRKSPDWRWGLRPSSNKSAWYKSMTIYDQKDYNNWHPVINKLADDLSKLASKKV